MKPIIKIFAGIIALLLVTIGGAAVYLTTQFDPNAYKAQIAAKVSETLGRKLTINGPVSFTVFPSIKLSLADVTLDNADWAGKEPMVQVKNLDASLSVAPLLQKQIVVEAVTLKGATLNLMQIGGRNNWTFASAKPAEKPGTELQQKNPSQPLSLEILALNISDTNLNYNANGKITKLQITDAKTSVRPTDPLALTANGKINSADFSIKITGDKFAGILSNADEWPVKGEVQLAATRINFDGWLRHPQNFGGGQFDVTASGNGADIVALTGSPLPFGKYDFKTRVTMTNAQNAALSEITFTTGQTRINGNLKLGLFARPVINGDINIPVLNLADFAGGPPAIKHSMNIVPSAYAADGMQPASLVPAIPLPAAALRAADANIKLSIGQIIQNGNNIASLDNTTISLNNGVLHAAPMKINYGGNSFNGDITLDGRGQTAALTATITSPQLDYGKLLSELKMTERVQGIGALNLNFSGSGNDLKQVMGGSRGHFTLTSNQGKFDTGILFDNVGGVISAVLPNVNIPKTANLHCAVFDFSGSNGVWSTNQSAVDADTVTLTLMGDANLGNEALSLKATPTIKNTKYGAVIPTLKIAGDFLHPKVTSDGSSVVQNALAAGALAKVKGLDVLTNLMKPKTAAATGPAGNACLAAVQRDLSGGPHNNTPTASTTTNTDPSSNNKQQLNNAITKGLQGLFGH